MNRNLIRMWLCAAFLCVFCAASLSAQQHFTLEQILSAPALSELTALKTGHRLAWVQNDQGRWNIWVADGPSFAARQLTPYKEDDGGELGQLQFLPGGVGVVYVRGEGKNSAGEYSNPTSNPAGTEQDVWLAAWEGGTPRKIDAGNSPASLLARRHCIREKRPGMAGEFESPMKSRCKSWPADRTRHSAGPRTEGNSFLFRGVATTASSASTIPLKKRCDSSRLPWIQIPMRPGPSMANTLRLSAGPLYPAIRQAVSLLNPTSPSRGPFG